MYLAVVCNYILTMDQDYLVLEMIQQVTAKCALFILIFQMFEEYYASLTAVVLDLLNERAGWQRRLHKFPL